MTQDSFIPFHRPSIDEQEITAVTEVLRSGWLTTGPRTAEFEAAFKAYVQAPHALAVNSCTAALHLALEALGLGPGDEVITTPLTFCATVNCILHAGATPVLADIGSDGNIDPDAILRAISSRTKAILPVHYGGAPCDMERIWDIARTNGLFVVEDAAHAVGAHWKGQPIGAAGRNGRRSDAVAFSFYATKNLSTGEGGMVTCHDPDLLERMRILCLHGISKDAWNRYARNGNWYYEVVTRGYKYNLSDLQSAIGLAQLAKQEALLDIRTACARYYDTEFAGVEEIEAPPGAQFGRHAWHLYPLRLNLDRLSFGRAEFIERLRDRGIGASVHFIPIPLHPAFAGVPTLQERLVPNAMALYDRLVSLPLYPGLTLAQLSYIAATVRELARTHRRLKTMAAG